LLFVSLCTVLLTIMFLVTYVFSFRVHQLLFWTIETKTICRGKSKKQSKEHISR